MDRRGFIGRILGTYVVSQIPFIAEAPAAGIVHDNVARLKAITELYTDYEKRLKSYSGILHLHNGAEIRVPKIKTVVRDCQRLHTTFYFDDVLMQDALTLVGMTLLSPCGIVLGSNAFYESICVGSGDTLKLTYNFNCDLTPLRRKG